MLTETYAVNVAGAPGAGTAISCSDLANKWVQISGTFTGTIALEISADGTAWHEVSRVAAPAYIEIHPACRFLRTNLIALAAGTIVAALTGELPLAAAVAGRPAVP